MMMGSSFIMNPNVVDVVMINVMKTSRVVDGVMMCRDMVLNF